MNADPSIAPPDEPDPALGRVIRSLREREGLTRADLAARAQIDPDTLAEIESGTTDPPWTTVRALATGLGTTVESIAEASEAPRGDASGR